MFKIKKGDEVVVTTGKDKGKRGKVLKILPAAQKAVVEGVGEVKKHVKPNPQANQEGGIIKIEMPIHLSNIAIYNSHTGKMDKVGIKTLEDGRKVRYFKSNNELIDI